MDYSVLNIQQYIGSENKKVSFYIPEKEWDNFENSNAYDYLTAYLSYLEKGKMPCPFLKKSEDLFKGVMVLDKEFNFMLRKEYFSKKEWEAVKKNLGLKEADTKAVIVFNKYIPILNKSSE